MSRSRRSARTSRAAEGRPVRRALLAACLLAGCASFPDPEEVEAWATPERGLVVSEHPLATAAGEGVLEAGGNAADAAVATALALAVVLPRAGNLGGGGIALWSPQGPDAEPRCLDFLARSPAELSADLFLDGEGRLVAERARTAPLAVAIPGTPAGLLELHRSCGRLPLAQVARPPILLAREGFPVGRDLARELTDPRIRAKLTREGMGRAVFYPRNRPLAEGDVLRQELLGDTIELLVQRGRDGFYRGDVAEAIVGGLAPGGGRLTGEDLAGYRVEWDPPLRGWFRGLEVLTAPPPSSGGLVLLQVLSILDGLPLDDERSRTRERARELGLASEESRIGLSGRAVHWWIEALRRAFVDRAEHLGDPDFHAVPVEALLSPEWIASRRISIGELASPGAEPLVLPPPESDETTHVSVVDEEGNAVSLTTTLNGAFGCGLMVRGGGFLLNDQIDDFALQPGAANRHGLVGSRANALAPGKRPLSSMAPTVLRDGGRSLRLVLGSRGGPRIVSSILQVILRTEVYGQSLAAAVGAPRLHQQWSPTASSFEEGWDALLLQELKNRDQEVLVEGPSIGGVQAIQVERGAVVGVADGR